MRIRSAARRIATIALAIIAGGVLAVGASSVAQAKGEYHYWNSSGNPLSVTGYGSTAKAYGQWRIADGSGGTRSFHDSYTWYSNADNHKKYSAMETWVNAGICYSPDYTSCTASYYYFAYDETSHSNVTSWEWLYADTGVSGSADYARDAAYVCLDIPLQPDPCSGPTYTTGSDY